MTNVRPIAPARVHTTARNDDKDLEVMAGVLGGRPLLALSFDNMEVSMTVMMRMTVTNTIAVMLTTMKTIAFMATFACAGKNANGVVRVLFCQAVEVNNQNVMR